jgi:hypothetical protein
MCRERRAGSDSAENGCTLGHPGVYSLFARYLSGAQGGLKYKKPPGHDSVRLLTRLPVSQFRRCCHHNRPVVRRFRWWRSRRDDVPQQRRKAREELCQSRQCVSCWISGLGRRDPVALPLSPIEGSTNEPGENNSSKRSTIPEPDNGAVLIGKRAGNWRNGTHIRPAGTIVAQLAFLRRNPPRVHAGEIDLNLNPALIVSGALRHESGRRADWL